jgi:hypothetical protein
LIAADARQADRISKAKQIIEISDDGAEFGPTLGWVTENQIVNLGTATATQQRALQLTLGLEPTAKIGTAQAQSTFTDTFSEQQALQAVGPSLTVRPNPDDSKQLEYYYDGAPLKSLAGATTVDTRVVVTAVSMADLVTVSGLDPNKRADSGKLRRVQIRYPASACRPVRAGTRLDYQIRHVVENDDTFMEGDDYVWIEHGKAVGNDITLLSTAELSRSAWTVTEIRADGGDGRVIHLGSPDGEGFQLSFVDLREAETTLSWLRGQKPARLAGHPIYLGPVLPDASAIGAGSSVFDRLAIRTDRLNYGSDKCGN